MNLENICIVLVGTLYGGNVGSVCRAMSNMGISDLRLVAPSSNVSWEEAERMACHATELLNSRKIYTDFDDAVADCAAVIGTTARHGLYRQHALTPKEQVKNISTISDNGKVAIVFGREDKGLLNDEVSKCTHLIQIPTDTEYSSLNLSQAVMVICYECFMANGKMELISEKSEIASADMKKRMYEMWRGYLLKIGFMQEEKANHMMAGINRIFSRGALTQNDVNILMGVIRQSYWALDHDTHNNVMNKERREKTTSKDN